MDIITEELRIQNGNRTIYGKLYSPAENGKHPAIILCHGYNGTNADWVQECGYYAMHGYVVYAFDFCGGSVNSKSTGDSTDMTITSEKEDLLAVFDHIRTMETVDSEKVVLFGGSQGGLVSALAAAERPDSVRALAMYFPALCIPDDWEKKYADPQEAPETIDFWGLTLGRCFVEDVHHLDVFGTIGKFRGNVMILHGDKDDLVPYSYSERAAGVYDRVRLIRMEGEGHGFSEQGNKTAMGNILEFLNEECG